MSAVMATEAFQRNVALIKASSGRHYVRTPGPVTQASAIGKPARVAPSAGNQARLRRLAAGGRPLQAKLTIGAINDPLEREADAAADRVMRMADPRVSLSSAPTLSRACAECEEEDPLRREATGVGVDSAVAPPIVHDVLNSPGRPLDPATHDFMASRFGTDFSDVRIHTDSRGARSAAAVDALAYTVGRNIVFGSGQYDPNTEAGRHLLAHELAHVVQYRGADMLNRKPLASRADKGPALRWSRGTTCSKWGFLESVRESGEGKNWKSVVCCNSWPFALEGYARNNGWAGAASCIAEHQREVATVSYGDQKVEVLCSDTIPPLEYLVEHQLKPRIIELSPAAMLALSGKLENLSRVSVTYSGSKIDLCLFGDDHTPSSPSAKRCLTRGCQPADGSPNDNSSWPAL